MPDSERRITHGRHCACGACRLQDWSDPQLAPCGMHGSSCPPRYDPWGVAGDSLQKPCDATVYARQPITKMTQRELIDAVEWLLLDETLTALQVAVGAATMIRLWKEAQ